MKQLIIWISMTTFVFTSLAQDAVFPLYKGNIPGNKEVEVEEVRHVSGSGSPMLTKVTKPELWWYSAGTESPRPAIIICPGGGYGYEAYQHEGVQVAQWLAELGYQAFVLKYRLPDETLFEQATFIPMADARQAIRLVRKMAKSVGVDAQKVGIMGFSAGGHLAASASTLFNKKIPYAKKGKTVRPDFSILIYPVISMTDELTHRGSRKALLGDAPSPEMIELFSLEKQVSPSTPPTFILHAADDKAVPVGNTNAYAAALRDNNVPVNEIILPQGGHGFGFRKESPAFQWTDHLAKWLENNIR